VSETFLAGLKSKANFEGRSSEKTWLSSILNRKIVDYYRKINSNKGKAEVKIDYTNQDQDGSWLEEQVSSSDSAENQIENKELGEAILSCLEHINPKHAEIFKMKTMQDYDNDVICKDMGITSSNLWVIIHRARIALASCLDNSWFKT
jgi:RNA polymerase sigma-70 factor (ECF subfamily)